MRRVSWIALPLTAPIAASAAALTDQGTPSAASVTDAEGSCRVVSFAAVTHRVPAKLIGFAPTGARTRCPNLQNGFSRTAANVQHLLYLESLSPEFMVHVARRVS